jgi:hypothetical protein
MSEVEVTYSTDQLDLDALMLQLLSFLEVNHQPACHIVLSLSENYCIYWNRDFFTCLIFESVYLTPFCTIQLKSYICLRTELHITHHLAYRFII